MILARAGLNDQKRIMICRRLSEERRDMRSYLVL